MKTIILFLFIVIASNAWAAEYVFQDLDCKLLGPGNKKVVVIDGDKSEYNCIVIGAEATCSYKNIETQKLQGQPTKYEVIDLDGVQIWSSGSGNIKMLIYEKEKIYYYGMTTIIPDKGAILNKQCIGEIVSQVK